MAKKNKNEKLEDTIIQVDGREQYNKDYVRYSIYSLMSRYVPSIIDGLKPVQRRILDSMYFDLKATSEATKRKSAKITGNVIGDYHPHGNCLDSKTMLIVSTDDGKSWFATTIGDLYQNDITEFMAYGYNNDTGELNRVHVHDLRIGQYTNTLYYVKFYNGNKIVCTGNHPFLLSNTGEYVEAKDLKKDMKIQTCNISTDGNTVNINHTSSERVFYVIMERRGIEVPMFDFTVDSTENMYICCSVDTENGWIISDMICVHNSGVYDAMKPMVNWFESQMPILADIANFGTFQGDPAAAERYTETYINKFGVECVIGDLTESKKVVNWVPTFDKSKKEPEALASKIPLLLINGAFSIAVGVKVEIPSHNINDVIDATLTLMDNPNSRVILIPDPPMPCEIVDTNWKSICNTGFGYYTVRGIIDTIHDPKTGIDQLSIKSVPELVFTDSIRATIENLIISKKLIQVEDIQDHSTNDQLDLRIILKKGSDPEYVKQVIYTHTQVQKNQRVDMEVLIGLEVKRVSYKAYLLYFLEFRRNVKFRLYNHKLQKAETRLHKLDVYIKILCSDDVEGVIKMIRNQSSMDEEYVIEWLVKKLKITDLQAYSILHTEIRALSKGHLKKYIEEQKVLEQEVQHCIKMITHPELIDEEIKAELIDIKNRYGHPRRSIIIKESDANNIPEGQFKIVITEQNFVKKMQIDDVIKNFKGDAPKCIIIADNTKDLLLFDEQGKVFRLPVHKIAFTDKNGPGIDIRLLLKKLTSNIRTIMYAPTVELFNNKISKHYLVTVTTKGMIKRMDLDDIINATPSGIIYSKLNIGDSVRDVIIAGNANDIVLYTKSKALRLSMASIPYLKRATLGNKAISGNDEVDGIAIVTQETTDIVVVTQKGKFNRFSITGLPVKDRGKSPGKVIKLSKGDYIKAIFSCNPSKNMIRVVIPEGIIDMNINDIPVGSSISAGTKLCKEGIIKCELLRV